MSSQPHLYGPGRDISKEGAYARQTDLTTSHAAAVWMKKHVSKREKEVFKVLRYVGPMTVEDVARWLNRPIPAVSPRFRPLADKNMIRPQRLISGKVATIAGDSGRQRVIWEVQPEQNDWIPLPPKTRAQRTADATWNDALEATKKLVTAFIKDKGPTLPRLLAMSAVVDAIHSLKR
jgi:hypothetical protein